MYNVTQNFIDDSRKFGREFDVKITWGDTVFTSDDIIEIEKEFTGDLFHTVMQEVKATVKGRHVLDSAVINIELGIGYRGSEKEYIDYGEFHVKEHTRIVGEAGSDDTTEFSANDAMLKFHELYDADDFNLTLPITLYDLFVKVANHFGIDVINTSINNGDKLITEDKWANIEEVTYRNILDEIAGASGGAIIVKNGELLLKYIDLDYLFNETIDFSGRPDIATTQSQITWEDLGFKYWYEFGNRTWEQFDTNELKHAYEINTIILPNQRYTLIVNDYDEDDTLGLWVNGEFLNFIYNGKIDFISDFEINSLIIKSYNGSSANFKLIGKGVSINEDTMMSLTIKEKLKPINILNITREQQHDNYVLPTNWESIPVDDRSEIVIPDNQIMDKDRATFAQDLLNQIEGISYHPFESESYGTVHFEPFDTVDVIDLDNKVHKSVITSHYMKITSGIKEELSSHEPTFKKEKYALVTDNQRAQMRVYFLVDQQNGIIEGLVNKTDDLADETASLRIDVDEINQTVENVGFGNILIGGSGETENYLNWTDFVDSDPLEFNTGMTFRTGMTNYSIFEPLEDPSVLSEFKLSFFANGRTENGLFRVFNGYKYGYRAKRVSGNQSFALEIREYGENQNYLRKQTYVFDNPKTYEEISNIEFGNDTQFVGLMYLISGVSWENRLEIAEVVHAIGTPKPWSPNAESVLQYAKGEFSIMNNKIEGIVSDVEIVDNRTLQHETRITQLSTDVTIATNKADSALNRVDNTTVKVSPEEGVEIWSTSGKGLTVRDANNNKKIELRTNGTLKAVDGLFENATVTGNLNAGKVGNLDVSNTGIAFPNTKLKLESTNNQIAFGTLKMRQESVSTDLSGIQDAMVMRSTAFSNASPIVFLFQGGKSFLEIDGIAGDSANGLSLGRGNGIVHLPIKVSFMNGWLNKDSNNRIVWQANPPV